MVSGKPPLLLHEELSYKKVEGINMMDLLRKVRGKEKRAYALLRMFSEKFKNVGYEIKTALAVGDSDRAARLVHSLKGSSGNIEAQDIYHLSLELEQVLHENNGYYSELLEQLDTCLESVNDSIIQILTAENYCPMTADDNDQSTGMISLQVDELRDLLEKRNMKAVRLFEELSGDLKHSLPEHIFCQLEMHIKNLKFDMAINDLKQIGCLNSGIDT